MRTATLLLLLAVGLAARPAHADGDAASFTIYRVMPGRAGPFAEGYARHIRWHLDARDPWPWYVWQIASGPLHGHFAGGTFDHPWAEHDRRPRPAEDAADHRRTIDVHRDGGNPRTLTRRRDLGGTLPLLETAPELVVIEVHAAPGRRGDVENAARRLATLAGAEARFAWYEVVVGGAPAYLLFVPLARASELPNAHLDRLWRAPAAQLSAVRAEVDRLTAASAAIDSTLLRFRADLSSCVRAASGCVGVVPPAR
jgi:hypothetical protein